MSEAPKYRSFQVSIREVAPLVLALTVIAGCSSPASTSTPTAQLQEYIDNWSEMGMWLPDQKEIDFFHLCLPESQEPLGKAIESPSYERRMRAAYVIGEIGSDARSFGPMLVQRLHEEPDRLVRLYICNALKKVQFDGPEVVEDLKQRFESLDENDGNPEAGGSKSDYLAADEKFDSPGRCMFSIMALTKWST